MGVAFGRFRPVIADAGGGVNRGRARRSARGQKGGPFVFNGLRAGVQEVLRNAMGEIDLRRGTIFLRKIVVGAGGWSAGAIFRRKIVGFSCAGSGPRGG
ncbi:MAG: hypothetical protein ACLGIE_02540 [Alphaproteobacteria bacterium]